MQQLNTTENNRKQTNESTNSNFFMHLENKGALSKADTGEAGLIRSTHQELQGHLAHNKNNQTKNLKTTQSQ